MEDFLCSRGCDRVLREIWAGESDTGSPIRNLGIDSLAILDWLFQIEERHGFEIEGNFLTELDIGSLTVPQLHQTVLDDGARS
jgi:hypothetical protein